jgi:16S rRNA (cytosine967-C5)-methyltransferase
VWDACAASGGKSILAYDLLPEMSLTVSDKRSSILANLRERFRIAGIKDYEWFVSDLAAPGKITLKNPPDLVIADLPCSGSGTWSRTPEQLVIFHESQLREYVTLQKKIIDKITALVVPGTYLLYITCSVFKSENEDILSYITSNYGSRIIRSSYLKGYGIHADTLFAALIRR